MIFWDINGPLTHNQYKAIIRKVMKNLGIPEDPELNFSIRHHSLQDGSYCPLLNLIYCSYETQRDLERTLAHELTHYSQFKSGELYIGHSRYYWQNSPINDFRRGMSQAEYECLPWELEANCVMDLYDLMFGDK